MTKTFAWASLLSPKMVCLGAAALMLSACATGPTPYAPMGTDGKLGYVEQAIENDRFRVSFVGKSEGEARDLALLRAAEIARERGYSHFEVFQGATDLGAQARKPRTSIGVGVGSGGGYYGRRRGTNVGVGLGFNLGSLGGSKVEHSIEVRLLRSGSDRANVYSAQGVLESIGSRRGVFSSGTAI